MQNEDGGAVATDDEQWASATVEPIDTISKAEFLERLRRREATLELPGGGAVRVQGLTVDDFGAIRGMAGEDADISETFKKVCLLGMLEPEITVEDLEDIGQGDLATITLIANKVMELSGMLPEGSAADFFGTTPGAKDSSSTA